MINAERVGHMHGFAQAAADERDVLPFAETALLPLAQECWRKLHARGYAHLEPEAEFCQGFVEGWRYHIVTRNQEYVLLSPVPTSGTETPGRNR